TFLPIPPDSHQIRLLGILCFERNTSDIESERIHAFDCNRIAFPIKCDPLELPAHRQGRNA
ncbi:MAG: hypothetical protein QF902_08555, partial [Rhodospirillales bacterium]|nr:hypothetical protein [Rhodospirillales bacterium]